jgi:hypothetical protein
MSSLFETHLVTVQDNGITYKPGTKQPTVGFGDLIKHFPCHIGRTGSTGSLLKLHVLKKHLDKIPKPLARGFRIIDENHNVVYELTENPIWAGGSKHHIECSLAEVI